MVMQTREQMGLFPGVWIYTPGNHDWDGGAGRHFNSQFLSDAFQKPSERYSQGNLHIVEGKTYYSIPELEIGVHKLIFRAWDIQNNSSTAELTFNVVRGLEPNCFGVSCTKNPATSETTFIISHDRTGSQLDVEFEVFDFAGRQLWRHNESGVPATGTYTLNWNLTTDGGSRLQTGVYLYRVRISSDGSSQASKAQKLIIISNK